MHCFGCRYALKLIAKPYRQCAVLHHAFMDRLQTRMPALLHPLPAPRTLVADQHALCTVDRSRRQQLSDPSGDVTAWIAELLPATAGWMTASMRRRTNRGAASAAGSGCLQIFSSYILWCLAVGGESAWRASRTASEATARRRSRCQLRSSAAGVRRRCRLRSSGRALTPPTAWPGAASSAAAPASERRLSPSLWPRRSVGCVGLPCRLPPLLRTQGGNRRREGCATVICL